MATTAVPTELDRADLQRSETGTGEVDHGHMVWPTRDAP